MIKKIRSAVGPTHPLVPGLIAARLAPGGPRALDVPHDHARGTDDALGVYAPAP